MYHGFVILDDVVSGRATKKNTFKIFSRLLFDPWSWINFE